MSSGIYSALSGAIAQERSLNVVSNNVANANTTGFKADRVAFDEALAQQVRAAGDRSASMRYVGINRVESDHETGSIRMTGRELDMAIEGEGFFAIETPAGERYTRTGAFIADSEGVLRTLGGHRVLADRGDPADPGVEISLPQGYKALAVGTDGTIMADGQQIAKLKLVRFQSPQAIEKEGLTFFRTTQGATPLAFKGGGSVMQGGIETSNVNAISGMNELITVTRSFDVLQRVIQTFRDVDGKAARDIASR